jgi:hypothetical protein
MKLTKEILNHIISCMALADENWRDNEDTHYLLPKSEEAVKWIIAEATKKKII